MYLLKYESNIETMGWYKINTLKYVLKSSYERSLGYLNSRDWVAAVIIYWVSLSLFSFKGYKKRAFYFATLISYVFLMYMFTVFERTGNSDYIIKQIPFWSYNEIKQGNMEYVLDVAFNTLMFVPVGVLLRLMEVKPLWMILTAVLLSYSIEVMQLIFKKGYFELFDDPFHNVLGAVLAYGLTSLVMAIGRRMVGGSEQFF